MISFQIGSTARSCASKGRSMTSEVLVVSSPSIAIRGLASPHRRPQKRPHEISEAANCSQISTSDPLPSLPWAQGVAGSNPVAPRSIPDTWVTVSARTDSRSSRHVSSSNLPPVETDPAALRNGERPVVERVGQLLHASIDARPRRGVVRMMIDANARS
jgi:hypothetical protein